MKQHSISLSTAILMNINIMVGGGIIGGAAVMAAMAGNASFLAWPLVALLLLPVVMATVQLSRMFPGAGGFYAYAKEGLGSRAGFFASWFYMFGYIFAAACELIFLRPIFLGILGDHWLVNSPLLFNVLCVGLVVLINSLSLRVVSGFLSGMTLIKLLPFVALIVSIPLYLGGGVAPLTLPELQLVPFAMTFALFGCFGFECCTSITHLIKDSAKNAPRAILAGFLITISLYTLFHFGLLQIMGVDNLVKYKASAFVDFMHIPYPWLNLVLGAVVRGASMLMLFAGITGITYANSTAMQTLADNKAIRKSDVFGMVNRKNRPWVAVLFQGVLILFCATLIPLTPLGNVTNLCICFSFVLPFFSLFIVQRRKNQSIILATLALLLITVLILYSWYNFGATVLVRFAYTLPMVAVLAAGYLMYNKNK